MTEKGRIRVVIDGRIRSGQSGGVEGVVIGLAHGLSQLDGPEEYVFVAQTGHTEWLEPYLDRRREESSHRRRPVRTPRPPRAGTRAARLAAGGARPFASRSMSVCAAA
jgi:hypothetical protein